MKKATQNIPKVPNLRFPRFEGEWGVKRLGDDSNILMCKRIFAEQTNEFEGIPFYKIGTLGKEPDAFISKSLFDEYINKYNFPKIGEILITCSGTVGKCIVFDGNDAYYQDSNIVWIDNPTLKTRNEFLYYVLSNINWGKLNSTTITRIYGSDLRNLKINYPEELLEQQKIASFLSLIDERIYASSKIIQSLESLMRCLKEKLFKQQIRFNDGASNEFPNWEERKIGEISLKKTSNISANSLKEDEGEYKVYGATGIFRNIDFYKEKEEYISIVKDGAGVGRLLLCEAKSSVLGTLDIIKNNKFSNLKFLYYILGSVDFSKYKTGSTIPHIYFKDYSCEVVKFPSLHEQTLIANFLTSIDEKIRIEERISKNYEKQKKYLLQNLFI